MRLNPAKIIAGLSFIFAAALFLACGNNHGDPGCVPNRHAACPAIYGPVCVQNSQDVFCHRGNRCEAEAMCETVLCGLDLDINTGGQIDPDSECALAHPDCLNPCP